MNRPVHFEVCTEQPAQLAEFYQAVLDWEIATWDGNQTYWLARTGEEGTPGIDGAIMHNHFPQAVINTIEVHRSGIIGGDPAKGRGPWW